MKYINGELVDDTEEEKQACIKAEELEAKRNADTPCGNAYRWGKEIVRISKIIDYEFEAQIKPLANKIYQRELAGKNVSLLKLEFIDLRNAIKLNNPYPVKPELLTIGQLDSVFFWNSVKSKEIKEAINMAFNDINNDENSEFLATNKV